METKIFKITMIFLLLGMVACDKEKEQCEPFVIMGGGDSQGCLGTKKERIITSQEEWENFIMPLSDCNINWFGEIEIDFEQYQIIAVIDEVRPSTGWGIYISCIKEYSDKIVVTLVISDPKGKPAFDVLTIPFTIAKIPASTKRIDFNKIGGE